MLILNGKISNEEMIQLDRGFFFGFGLFETILVKNYEPIFLKEHLKRLNAGLETLKMKNIVNESDIRKQLLMINEKDYCLKITVSEKNLLLTIRELTYKKEDYEAGMSLKISNSKRNPSAITTYLKSLNYTDNLLEKQKAMDEGYHEALFLNVDEFIAEGSMSNIFFIKDYKIYTPSVECGLLAGIVRNWIVSQFGVIEGRFTLKELLNSDGIFITNSLMGIMKVYMIGDVIINNHPIIEELQKKYISFLEVSSHESTH